MDMHGKYVRANVESEKAKLRKRPHSQKISDHLFVCEVK